MEPVGLVVGVVGLAGLFSACIDCFELVQRGRYHGKDYLLLETKFTNQRLRLMSWGRACGFLNPDGIDDRLEDEHTTAAIESTLVHLKTLFNDGHTLRSKYGLKHDRTTQGILALVPASFGALVPSNFPSKAGLGQKLHELRQSTRIAQKSVKLGSQVRWAIEDRSKFMDLIRDLKDLIDDLEGLTKWLSVPERQHRNIEIEVESILDLSTLETMEEARLGRIDAVADAASVRLWQLRDQFLEPIQIGTSNISIASPSLSLISIEDGWEDVSSEELQLHQGNDSPICYQILHKVCCAHEPTLIFLDIPLYSHSNGGDNQWVALDDEHPACEPRALHLCGRRLVPDLEAYMTQNQKLSFIVFKNYRCSHDQMMGKSAELERSADSIYLWSQELCTGLREVFGKTSLRLSQLDRFRPKVELQTPYLWYYDSREELILELDGPNATWKKGQSVEALLDVVLKSMTEEYSVVDALLAQKIIQWKYLGYLYRVGDVVLQSYGENLDHCQAYEVLSTRLTRSGDGLIDSVILELRTWEFDGTFQQVDSCLSIALSRFKSEARLPVTALSAIPIQYAKQYTSQRLTQRGRMYYELRNKKLVAYTGSVIGSDTYLHQRRFMIDTSMYKQICLAATDDQEDTMRSEPDAASTSPEKAPEDSFLLMLPASIHGYDLLDKRWSELLVSNISDVKWDAELFEQVILPDGDKNLLCAMTKQPGSNDNNSGSPRVYSGQHAFILCGDPGSGKTFTAEAIAEVTKRPLYQISCTDISTNAVEAREYLRFASKLCNTWDCVVLFEDLDTLGRRDSLALTNAHRDSLDFFTGVVILNSHRDSSLAEIFESRIQLNICLKKWWPEARKKVWSHMIKRLPDTTDYQVDDLLDCVSFLAEREQNG